MEFHLLDLICYFVGLVILWYALDKFSGGEFTNEMGALIGWFISLVYTITYIIFFWFLDYNIVDVWSDISINITW